MRSVNISASSLVDEEVMNSDHLVLPITLSTPHGLVHTYALIDSGASATAFIDSDFATLHRFDLRELQRRYTLNVVDGRPIDSGILAHRALATMQILNHNEELSFFVTKLGHYPVILGIKWLQHHDPSVKWDANILIFNSTFCKTTCLTSEKPAIIKGMLNVPDKPDHKILPPTPPPTPPPRREEVLQERVRVQDIAIIGAAPFNMLSKKENCQVFALSLREINRALGEDQGEMDRDPSTTLLECCGITADDIDKALAPKEVVDVKSMLPEDYWIKEHVFSQKLADTLPPHRPEDYDIPLLPGKQPPYSPLRGMSQDELRVLKKYLEENLAKGFIRPSNSPAAAPILFVKKPSGGLRLCVDYRGLNDITVKNRYPLPLIKETLERLSRAKWFTKLDVIGAFNRLRLKEGEEWKSAFLTRYGLYEYLVMPFGLHGAPAKFQGYINKTLQDYLDIFCSAYMDDILIYSDTLKEHKEHVRLVLDRLDEAGLQIDITKCEFHKEEVKYLGLIVGRYGVRMDPAKVSAIQSWPRPQNKKDVQSFIGFANFYRRFVKGFSEVAAPLTALTGGNSIWLWSGACEEAFETLKQLFCSAPILALYDPDLECIVETDASDHVSGGVLSQHGKDGILRPVAYFSKKHSPAECNYEIYDKELLAVIQAFQEWRTELEGSPHEIKVLSDHKNLQWFMTTKQLNRRQARWAEYLSRFNFKIHYRPGRLGTKPDALTRRSGDLPSLGDPRIETRNQIVLKPHHIAQSHLCPLDVEEEEEENTLEEAIAAAYGGDAFAQEILKLLRDGTTQSKKITLSECEERDHQFWYQGRLYIPDNEQLRLRVCEAHHDAPAAGHNGRTKTLELVRRSYFWPEMRKFIGRYVRNCQVCAKSKSRRYAKFGVLRPLPVPNQRWKDISMDFVTGLPLSDDKDAILVIVDRLTKMRHFIATTTTASAETVADLYVDYVYRIHGLPDTVVSDRGPQFVALFWKILCLRLGTSRLLSTAFHPETDGQTEISNASMEQYLRAYTSYQQDDWVKWLGLAEFAANNAFSEPIQCSPFFANYGYNPRMGFEPRPQLARLSLPAEINAHEYANHMEDVLDVLKSEMAAAQAKYEDDANQSRTPAPTFKVGDLVWLDARNIRTKRPTRKLDWKNLGRFAIKTVLSNWAYELDLPDTMKIHPVFHVSKLSPVPIDPFPGQVQAPAQPIEVDGDVSWEVEEILDSKRVRGGHVQYLIKWIGYDAPTWEPSANVDNCENELDRFHALYPDKPKPRRRASSRRARPAEGEPNVTARNAEL